MRVGSTYLHLFSGQRPTCKINAILILLFRSWGYCMLTIVEVPGPQKSAEAHRVCRVGAVLCPGDHRALPRRDCQRVASRTSPHRAIWTGSAPGTGSNGPSGMKCHHNQQQFGLFSSTWWVHVGLVWIGTSHIHTETYYSYHANIPMEVSSGYVLFFLWRQFSFVSKIKQDFLWAKCALSRVPFLPGGDKKICDRHSKSVLNKSETLSLRLVCV